MSRVRLVLLSLLAVFAVSAIASASASAAACEKKAESKKYVLCVGEPLVLTEGKNFDIDVEGEEEVTLVRAGSEIKCKLLTTLVLLNSEKGVVNTLPFKLHLEGCTVGKPANCSVEDLESKKALILTLNIEGHFVRKEDLEFLPSEKIHFADIRIVGAKCLIAGVAKVTSEAEKVGPLCLTSEVTENPKKLNCAKPSHLKWQGEEAEFKAKLKLTLLLKEVADKFTIIEGI